MIPRKIHQIFLTGSLPPRLREQVEALEARNPGWDHRIWNDGDAQRFISEYHGELMLDTYRLINPEYGAARADLLRHLLIYSFGGVYLDIKSDIAKPLDEVIRPDDHYLLAQWDEDHQRRGFGQHPELSGVPGGEYLTHFIIGEPRHNFSRAAIDRIARNVREYKPWSGVGKMGVVRTTGPSAYTLAVHPLRLTCRHRMVTEAEIGSTLSIGDYDHRRVFTRHYSTLTAPVAKLGVGGRIVQRGVEAVRALKQRAA